MKRVTAKFRDAGATLVEMGLLISLIAVVAIPAVSRLGSANACQFCKVRYCLLIGDVDTCGNPAAVPFWETDCVNDYESIRPFCEGPMP